jgi:SpoVK/Ycf46/Vps4 family AAA+-type ATPase
MGPPNKKGRMALFEKFLTRMPVSEDVRACKLAAITEELSGAEIEHAANEAGLLAVKEAIASSIPTEAIQITAEHFLQAIRNIKQHTKPSHYPVPPTTQILSSLL